MLHVLEMMLMVDGCLCFVSNLPEMPLCIISNLLLVIIS